MSGEMDREKLSAWLKDLGDDETPLDNEVEESFDGSRRLPARNTQHHIDTRQAAPIMLKRRRQAQTEDAIVDDNVDNMLKAGVIEEGNGAWGFPVVSVKKKDSEVRFCIEYRALNKITKNDVYPLPRIDETLEALGGARLFTTLDLRSGYWQIGMAPEDKDKDKTTFTTKRGLYMFTGMPFGLINAPSTFQRMINGGCVG
ncbi:hypothetical protein PC118_g14451 [Phytophthora cactorum]|uniref:Reverse transcriptase domain-containing protein n=1 Tax=Phytophthora cactorum TaxID=29920 RepID=A0A329SXF2_9STRA|nr:hypothetical protein PC111_g13214 [Phytophthora cactorum]KAG2906994.1 hypothetical protein PC115_g14075 [Phytophthora cactorum]KAG2974557.1 hypothetical protein PC118_g14451 [Phytophthora cactorum]KAG3005594.1 hypothetical protein PC119_g15249 [Phytophthora cactorum]RAW41265.1 hypothetical protein PC110_g2506 [Phytophthora cactorum]